MRRFLTRAILTALVGAGVAVALVAIPVVDAQQKDSSKSATCTLNVTGMGCAGCAAAVKMAAKKVDGVADAAVSYEKGRAVVTYDPAKTTPEKIAKAVADGTGYKAEVQKQK